jgi:hypothetical protein
MAFRSDVEESLDPEERVAAKKILSGSISFSHPIFDASGKDGRFALT